MIKTNQVGITRNRQIEAGMFEPEFIQEKRRLMGVFASKFIKIVDNIEFESWVADFPIYPRWFTYENQCEFFVFMIENFIFLPKPAEINQYLTTYCNNNRPKQMALPEPRFNYGDGQSLASRQKHYIKPESRPGETLTERNARGWQELCDFMENYEPVTKMGKVKKMIGMWQ